MPRKTKLYMFTGSMPSMTARLMLEHKGIDHKPVELMIGIHALGLLGRGFETMTVPALRIGGRRIQGSREISRALDELVPEPPLSPRDAEQRLAVREAERFGEELQASVRRLKLCAVKHEPRVFRAMFGHTNPLKRVAQRLARGVIVRLVVGMHRATDSAGEQDVAALAAQLDQIDRWIEAGVLGSAELNAADFQIAPNIAALLDFEALRPFIEGRPAAGLARRLVPGWPRESNAGLPADWLTPLVAPARRRPELASTGSAPALHYTAALLVPTSTGAMGDGARDTFPGGSRHG